jgi:Mg/Co/Ni transporter MgtE
MALVMDKQTAVEWFYQRILAKDIKEVFEQAKEMEKEQIINTFKHAQVLHAMNDQMRGEQYSNETYGK